VTIWERIKAALTPLNVPISANSNIASTGSNLPDLYLVYFLISAPPEQHADDQETLRTNHVQVTVYSHSGLAILPDVDGAMTIAGFTRGPMRELPYNQQTRHFGLALEYYFLEGD